MPEFVGPSSIQILRGMPVNIQLEIENGFTEVSTAWLPSGISLNSATGLITGTTLTAVQDNQTLFSATNENGTTEGFSIPVIISNPPLPTITSSLVAAYVPSVPFNYQLTGTNIVNAEVSDLPAGLNFNPTTRVISGTSSASSLSIEITLSNAAGNTTATLVNDTVAPSTPQSLAASEITTTSVKLTWTMSTDNVAVNGYMIYINGSQDGYIANQTGAFVKNGLTPGTTYTFSLKARDQSMNLSDFSNEVEITTLI